jgi:ribosomal protein S12 methylthiotransferase
MTRPRRFYLHRLGCPKNDVDAENMAGLLVQEGYEACSDPARADVLLVNTCGFIGDAKAESIDAVLELSRLRRKRQKLIVTGCLTQRYGDQLAAELPEVDVFVGTGAVERIVEAVRGEARLLRDGDVFLAGRDTPRARLDVPHTAYVKIGDGCNRRCAFCAIPLFKGRQQSRALADVVAEVGALSGGPSTGLGAGAKELVLVAQDTSAWGSDLTPPLRLPALLEALDGVPGYAWLRLLYLYPDRVDDALLRCLREHPRLLPYLDLPMQHASDRVLKRMARGTSRGQLEALLDRVRAALPDAVLRTALIVGFPGETEADFLELVDFVEAQRLDHVGVFTYSDEEGTAAAGLDGQVPDDERARRRDELMRVQQAISAERLAAWVGREVEVLVDEVEPDGARVGRTRGQAPEIDGVTYLSVPPGQTPPAVGDLVRATIDDSAEYDLFATARP